MKCPFRKIKENIYENRVDGKNILLKEKEHFQECYEEDCPAYRRENKVGDLALSSTGQIIVPAGCIRIDNLKTIEVK